MTKQELERYIDRAIISGKQLATSDVANYLEQRSLALFQGGKDEAAVELRETAKMFRQHAELFAQRFEALTAQARSSDRRGQIEQAGEEVNSQLEVDTE
jgi:hypothetical protein